MHRTNYKNRGAAEKVNGFTLIEILVVTIVVGILFAIALPNFISAEDKAKLAAVKANMHTVQIASEGYKTDTGSYATSAVELDPYFPGGSFHTGGASGTRPDNPITGQAGQSLYNEAFSTSAMIVAERSTPPGAGSGSRGQIGYCPADIDQSYAICGLDSAAKRLCNSTGGTMILSNQ